MKRISLRAVALTSGMVVAASALADRPQGINGPGYGMGPGMMGGGMMGGDQGEAFGPSRTDAPGSAIFGAHCASCHRNGGNVITPSLPLAESRKLTDFKTFLDFIRHPQMPDGSPGAMPAFAQSDLSDPQAEILYQYLTAMDGSGKSGN